MKKEYKMKKGDEMKWIKKIGKPGIYLPLTLIALTTIIPIILPPFLLHVAIMILLYSYLGTAWNILGGYTGQFAWGHSAFFGIGAYTSTTLYIYHKISPWIGMLIGSLFAAGYGALCGAFTFRFGLKGHYFVIATIALSEIIRIIFINWAEMGRAWGILLPVVPDSWIDFQFHTTKLPYYYIALTMLLTIIIIEIKIINSKLGYYLTAIRDDEELSESLGINTFKYKMIAMIISAALTSFGGTFYAQYVLYISPETVMPVGLSTEILMGPIIGGLGTIMGPIIGAIIVQPIHEFTRAYITTYTGIAGLDYVVAGTLMLTVALLQPKGVIQYINKILYSKTIITSSSKGE